MSSSLPPLALPLRNEKMRRERLELLLAWYGMERAQVEMTAHTARPRSVDELLTELLNSDIHREWSALLQLRSQWTAVAGSGFSRFTFPQSLHNGVLTLSVRHSALLLELKPSLNLFLNSIEKILGPGCCQEIRLAVGGGSGRG